MNQYEFEQSLDIEQRMQEGPLAIGGPAEAASIMRMLAKTQREFDDVEKTKRDEIDSVIAWADDRKDKLEKRMAYLRQSLGSYIAMRRQDVPDFNVRTRFGNAHLKPASQRIEVFNEDIVIESLQNAGRNDLLREQTIVHVDKRKLAGDLKVVNDEFVVDSNGTVVEGVAIINEPERVVVRLSKEEVA